MDYYVRAKLDIFFLITDLKRYNIFYIRRCSLCTKKKLLQQYFVYAPWYAFTRVMLYCCRDCACMSYIIILKLCEFIFNKDKSIKNYIIDTAKYGIDNETLQARAEQYKQRLMAWDTEYASTFFQPDIRAQVLRFR